MRQHLNGDFPLKLSAFRSRQPGEKCENIYYLLRVRKPRFAESALYLRVKRLWRKR